MFVCLKVIKAKRLAEAYISMQPPCANLTGLRQKLKGLGLDMNGLPHEKVKKICRRD